MIVLIITLSYALIVQLMNGATPVQKQQFSSTNTVCRREFLSPCYANIRKQSLCRAIQYELVYGAATARLEAAASIILKMQRLVAALSRVCARRDLAESYG